MGRLYEVERNKSIVRRVWAWAVSTLGIGGISVAVIVAAPEDVKVPLRSVASLNWPEGKMAGTLSLWPAKL